MLCVVNMLPACRRLLFPLLHAEKGRKEIGDVCTQASKHDGGRKCLVVRPKGVARVWILPNTTKIG